MVKSTCRLLNEKWNRLIGWINNEANGSDKLSNEDNRLFEWSVESN